MIERGSADLAQEFAWELPYLVFFDFMGLPHEPMLRTWSNDFRDREDGKTPTKVALAAMDNVRRYLAEALVDRRKNPRDDLLTEIVHGTIDGEPLAKPVIETDSEIVGLCFLLFIAGTDTTTSLIANAFHLLALHPDQRADLVAHPDKIPNAVEEVLRYDTPLQIAARNTTAAVRLHGATIPSGGRVVLVFGAANRDDREFPEPDRFDVSRNIKRTVAFGEGIHFCLGAPLARLEARIALELGIPFAGPYHGARRFRPPTAPAAWTGVYEADSMPHPVPQIPDDNANNFAHIWSTYYDIPASDDGLWLNLWTPRADSSAKLPVMVWLHGGGFATGAPTRPRERGAALAANGRVVVVSPTHRLGASGYLYLDELSGGRWSTANLGMLDIVAALEWVRDNIPAFGGDPGNVTVFGESGGAAKTHTLMAMPAAAALFHKAVLQAGAMSDFGGIRAMSRAQATETSQRYLHALGVSESDLSALQRVSMQDVVRADMTLAGDLLVWRPVVDGTVLPEAPSEAARQGRSARFPLMVGSSRYEMDALAGPRLSLERTVGRLRDADRERLLSVYRANRSGQADREAELAFLTDFMFRIPGIALAQAQRAAGQQDIYMYLFDLAYDNPRYPDLRATHGSETVFAFNTTETTDSTRGNPHAARLAAQVSSAWAAFAWSGNPNHADLSGWRAYDASQRATMLLKSDPELTPDPQSSETAAWSAFLAQPLTIAG